jgi:ankyrin repeat protein
LEEAQWYAEPRVAILEKGEPPQEESSRSFGFWFSAKKRALFEAIASGDAEAVREALAKGAKPNSRLQGEPAVLKAAYRGRVAILKMLIAAGADVDRPVTGKAMGFGGPNRTALVMAAFEGHVECVRVLLRAGARVDASMLYRNKLSMCALSAAAFNGHLEIVRLLLRRTSAIGHPWDRPLCYAVHGGTPDVVRLLLQAGADANTPMDRRLGDSVIPWLPLSAAFARKDDKIIQILREAGAKATPLDHLARGW